MLQRVGEKVLRFNLKSTSERSRPPHSSSVYLATGVVIVLISGLAPVMGQRRPQRSTSPPVQQVAAVAKAPADSQSFDTIAAAASAARDADKIDEAISLYQKAVSLRPSWAEGWWFLGTLYYDHDKYAEAAPAFKQTAVLQQKAGSPWAMLGLCEFQLARYDEARAHLDQARKLGVGDNQELVRVMRYHDGLLSILKGDFEKAQETLGSLSYEGLKSEELIISLGLAILRIGMTPKEITINYPDRALIRRAGLAEHFAAEKNMSDAQREYDMLARDYGKVANVQYAYGRFLLVNRDDDGAQAAFQRELQNWPRHALARCHLANIKLRNRDIEGGLPLAEEAVKIAPRLPLGHYVFGRLLLEAGQADRAIGQLEIAAQMVPNEPKIYFALARAYTKAKRKPDADKARATFTRLSQVEGAGQESGLPDDNTATDKPAQP
jgi:tetratricopeptide (TPR) repeat protein